MLMRAPVSSLFFSLAILALNEGCISDGNAKKLPVWGEKQTAERTVNGKTIVDSLDYTIPDFHLVNADAENVSPKNVEDKIYVADFFFISCRTICPKVKKEMLRVYNKFERSPEILLLSHTIDPKRDTVERLLQYAQKLEIDRKRWLFVTSPSGSQDEMFALANAYFIAAVRDTASLDGMTHSGGLVLVDTHRRVRGVYDGTSETAVDKLMADMELLLAETKREKEE